MTRLQYPKPLAVASIMTLAYDLHAMAWTIEKAPARRNTLH